MNSPPRIFAPLKGLRHAALLVGMLKLNTEAKKTTFTLVGLTWFLDRTMSRGMVEAKVKDVESRDER